MSAGAVLAWALEMLVASTLLMALVLLVRGRVRRAFGPDVAYALWLLPLLRMALPPLPASWRELAAAPVSAASETITIYMVEPLSGAAPVAAATASGFGISAGVVLLGLWLLGALAFGLWHVAAHARFCRRIIGAAARETTLDGVHLIESDAASGPLAFGLLRKYVAFPRDFAERYDSDERDLALAHELGHHQRGDLLANWIALGVLACHWFNPVAWRAFRAFRADQEIANDARVLAGCDAMTRHAYACAIVKAAHGGAVSAACHLHTIEDLKGRLTMLKSKGPSRPRLLAGMAGVGAITLAGLAVTASGTQAAERVRTSVETVTGVELTTSTVAAALAAPAAPMPVTKAAAATAAGPQDAMPPLPPVPPAPPAPVAGEDRSVEVSREDGKVKKYRVVIRKKDGTVETRTGDAFAMPDIPEIKEGNCTLGDRRQMTVTQQRGDKKRIVICTNRIEAAAAEGAKAAERSGEIARNAKLAALDGLKSARATIAANRDMSEAQRAEALASIDESMVELRSDKD